jgi:hypothetical protein
MGIRLNEDAVKQATRLIKDGRYILESDWSEEQPSASEENKYLRQHNWKEFGCWYLGLDTDEDDDTKGRYKFPYGDFKKVHRDGLIAAKQRAAQYNYRDIEKSADELLQMLEHKVGNHH